MKKFYINDYNTNTKKKYLLKIINILNCLKYLLIYIYSIYTVTYILSLKSVNLAKKFKLEI